MGSYFTKSTQPVDGSPHVIDVETSFPEELCFKSDLIDFRIEKNTFQDGETVTITYTHKHGTTFDADTGAYYDINGNAVMNDPSGAWFGLFPKSAGLDYRQDPTELTAILLITAEGQVGPWELRFYSDMNNESIVGKIPFFVEGDSYDPIMIELDKTVVNEGDTLNVKFEFDRRHQLTTPRIHYYTKSTPSTFHVTTWYALNTFLITQTVPVLIETHGACGWHEMRCFTSHDSYMPSLRVPFYVNTPNPVKLRCHPLNVKDGGTIDVDWDIPPNAYIEFYLCFYPKDNLIEENGFTFPLSERSGSARVQIESGQKSTGAWEVRLVERYTMLVMAVAPFTLIGAKEAFSYKMLGNIKFVDVFID